MWPFRRKAPIADLPALTAEDLQVLAKAFDEKPEYFQFWLGVRAKIRRSFEAIPLPKTRDEMEAYAFACRDMARDCQFINQVVEMPIMAARALERIEAKATEDSKKQKAPKEEPWDEPFVPEEKY